MRRRILAAIAGAIFLVAPSLAEAPLGSLRPVERSGTGSTIVQNPTQEGLRAWIAAFRPRALAQGITAGTFDSVMNDARYDADVVKRDRNQSEFTKTIWDYLDTAASDLRVTNGKAALAKWDKTLIEIERTYGVDKEIVTAIWGLESSYGVFRGGESTLDALATLAYDGRRAEFFEQELIDALRILQDGDITLAKLKGSWAGAMGHTQFMPSSFQEHAVDHDGDGRRDIWSDNPVDALASTAAYLKNFGWTTGQPWGVEVRLPDSFDFTLARRDMRKLPSDWAVLGVTQPNGTAVRDFGLASVLLPGGAEGVAFLVFQNFEVLERYNTADAYVIGVGHLADRIRGAGPFEKSWPRHLRVLSHDERIELQKRLTAAGFDTEKIDAKMGPLTIGAIRKFQQAQGVVPDGYPSLSVLERLRAL